MKGKGERIVLDLEEITLVDLDVVRFLGVSEAEGVELMNCSPYIRDWIFRERNTEEEDWLRIPGADRRLPGCDAEDKLKGENQRVPSLNVKVMGIT